MSPQAVVVPFVDRHGDRGRGQDRASGQPCGDSGAAWVGRVARTLHPVQAGAACGETPLAGGAARPLYTAPDIDLDGLPVLLVSGLVSTPDSLRVLRDWLLRAGAQLEVSPVSYGVDCGERTTRLVEAHARGLAERAGRPCLLLAHSRGGHFARAVAVRRPELVAGLVTLGTPVNRLLGVHPLLRAELAVLAALGTLGVPGVIRASCLWGTCCRQLRADLRAPLPAGQTYLVVFSEQDEVVDWRSCLDPWARHQAVTASHSGMLRSPEVLQVLAAELGSVARRYAQPAAATA
ncbi:MAG: esterase/lipase family protein [Actinomycetes bacterium]